MSFPGRKKMLDIFGSASAVPQVSTHDGGIDRAELRIHFWQLSPPAGFGQRVGAINPLFPDAQTHRS
jgi:hypothetical protein